MALAFAATCAHGMSVSGHVQTTTWTSADSPVHVTDTLFVDAGATLTIGPGVDVLFDAVAPIVVRGQLVAQGTASDSIRFLLGTAERWAGLRFAGGGTGDLSYARISGVSTGILDTEDGWYGGSVTLVGASASLHAEHCVLSGNRGHLAGGLSVESRANAVLENCSISDNVSSRSGGGARIYTANATFTNCEIVRNSAGGVDCRAGSQMTMTDCLVEANHDSSDSPRGGGITVDNARAEIVRCTIVGNSTTDFGGGVLVEATLADTRALVRGCLIVGNRARIGSAVSAGSTYRIDVDLVNCTLAGNTSDVGGCLSWSETAPIDLVNTIVWGNEPRIGRYDVYLRSIYSYVEGVALSGAGNVSSDPLFVDPENGDYHLLPGSPCIAAGSPYYIGFDGGPSDIGVTSDGTLNPAVPRIDATDEVTACPTRAGEFTISNTGGGTLTVSDLQLPEAFTTATVFPAEIPAGESVVVRIAFDGSVADTTTTALIVHDDPFQDTVRVALRGTRGTVATALESGTWVKARSPYRIREMVTIPPDGELVIEPGVEVIFEADVALWVQGSITVAGSAADSVRFLGSGGQGGGVQIETSRPCAVAYARLSGLGSPYRNPLSLTSASVTLSHVVISGNSGYYGSAVLVLADSRLVMADCRISGNTGSDHSWCGGIQIAGGATGLLTGCEISSNVTSRLGVGGLSIASGATCDLDRCLIVGNACPRGVGGLIADDAISLSRCAVAGNIGEDTGGILILGDRAAPATNTHVLGGTVDLFSSIICGNEGDDVRFRATGDNGVHDALTSRFSDVGLLFVDDRVGDGTGEVTERPGVGNVLGDPLFVDAGSADYHLLPGSPCTDTGTPYLLDDDGTPADIGYHAGTGGPSSIPRIAVEGGGAIRAATPGEVRVFNRGGADLAIDSVVAPDGFETTASFPRVIPAGDSLMIPVVFISPGRADVPGDLIVYHSDPYRDPVHVEVHGFHGTDVSGVVSGSWTAAEAPYRLKGDVIVPTGETLVVEAGVSVLADTTATIRVEGRLQTLGTMADSVVFDAGIAEAWGGIVITGSDSSTLVYARVSRGAADWGIRSVVLYAGGGVCVSDSARICLRNCVVSDNRAWEGGGGVRGGGKARVHLVDCLVTRNSAAGGSIGGGGLRLGSGSRLERTVVSWNFANAAAAARFAGSVTVTDCEFSRNSSYGLSGAAATIVSNSAGVHVEKYGHGDEAVYVFVDDKEIVESSFRNCTFTDNTVDGDPLFADASTVVSVGGDSIYHVTFSSCRIEGNHGPTAGAALGVYGSSLYPSFPATRRRPVANIVNTVIAGNVSAQPACVLLKGATVTMTNCTVTGNAGQSLPPSRSPIPSEPSEPPGSPVSVESGAGVWLTNTIIWGNGGGDLVGDVSARYCAIMGGHEGEGNIALSPMFADSAAGDFTLVAGSPCIDAGDPDSPLDQDGTRCDMGAHANISEALDVEQPPAQLELSLGSPFPNPFNPTVSIPYTVPEAGHVGLTVYNVQGQVVRRLVDGTREAGAQAVAWDGRDELGRPAASGVYLCRLTTTAGARVTRMLLVR